MAFRPCTRCRRLYRGPAATFYFALVHGADRLSWREWLCPDCREGWEKIGELELHSSAVVYETQWQLSLLCCVCSSAIVFSSPCIFATAYCPGSERADFYGGLCLRCNDSLREYAQSAA